MNPAFLKSMKAKKKREVDPNAPPRPNLMTHDVKIKDQQSTIDHLNQTIYTLKDQVRRLEQKLNNQQIYLQAVHNKISKIK